MKKNVIVLRRNTKRALWEAMRRYIFLVRKNRDGWIDDKFTGLGTWSFYKYAVNQGVMKYSFPYTLKGVDAWFMLTPLGIKIVKQLLRKKIRPVVNAIKWNEDFKNIPNKIVVYI